MLPILLQVSLAITAPEDASFTNNGFSLSLSLSLLRCERLFAQKTQFHRLFLTVRTEAVLGPQLVALGVAVKNPSATASFGVPKTSPWRGSVGVGTGLMIECSSRPQKKATAHHKKTRPRKTQPWDVKRKPTVYTPLPPLPADWTLVSSADEASSSSSQEPPTTE
ncbi:PREDICTED: 50S ribosomal 6 [Prunus dulcis]|uniref:PREDICTED: 50S ribosomal 6 n=1 Tax=Prunus dulcis TaxID=3755 RepID=A0A5E4FLL6_PRUDU|nr:PREDICTED: 50S ribosomal 6 [Prunus dulcis]